MRAALAALALAAAALAGPGVLPGPPAPASASAGVGTQPIHHAALIVDTGVEVRRVCVGFSEDSISGKELLDRAGVDPVYRPYGDQGVGVCALCGTGCPADESCLTCGGSSYWAYHRAPAGSGDFDASGVGASSTRVRDGDVDGWRWGPGGPPPFASFAEVCPGVAGAQATTTTAAAGPAPPPTASAPAPTAPTPTAASIAPTTVPPAPPSTAPATTITAPVASTSSTVLPSDDDGDLARGPLADDEEETSGGSPASLALFGAAMTGLLAWIVVARRARRRRLA